MQGSGSELIRVAEGRPVILHDGKPVSQAAYCDYIIRDDWEERIREFVESGVKVFYLRFHPSEYDVLWGIEEADRKTDPTRARLTMPEQAEIILGMQPEALFYIRPSSTVPEAWAQKHPEEMQTDEDGGRHRDASLSSEVYLRDVARCFGRLVDYCEGQPWGERIVGYLDAPHGEGIMPLNIDGKMFDCSPANQKAFRNWVRNRYATEQELREAWNDPTVTFDTVRVPTDREWVAKRDNAQATIKGVPFPSSELPSNARVPRKGLFHWIEASNAVREHDYCRFQREMFLRKFRTIARAIKEGCARAGRRRVVGFDIAKQPLMGWQILSSFDGIGDGQHFPNMALLSGSWDVGELLDDENIDLIFTPADYHARTVGFAYEAEGVSDSLLVRGKAMIIENDARCYVGSGVHEQGAFRNEKEVRAGLLRNAALTLSRGLQSYWCNVGSSYFHDAAIHKTIAKLVPMLERLNEAPHRETPHAVAFIIDDESLMTEDFTSGYQTLSVIWQRILGLAHCGVPYRLYLLSDLRKDTFPSYRTWFFPNLFVINDEVLDLLRQKVLRDGNLAIFGPATGISDGRFLGAEGASELLGVPMELIPRTTVRHVIVQDAGHPITRELPASMTYGDSLSYGPTLVPGEWAVENAGGVPLGHATTCWFINRTGLFLKEEGLGAAGNGKAGKRGPGDYALLWTCAMPLPASLLRAAARYGGSHIWCEEDDVIYASDSLVALHSVKAGPRLIKLPRPCTVCEAVSGRKVGEDISQISVNINPPDTHIFTLE